MISSLGVAMNEILFDFNPVKFSVNFGYLMIETLVLLREIGVTTLYLEQVITITLSPIRDKVKTRIAYTL